MIFIITECTHTFVWLNDGCLSHSFVGTTKYCLRAESRILTNIILVTVSACASLLTVA